MAGIPPVLLARMGQDVVVEPYSGAGARGPLYGSAATIRALVEIKRRATRGKDGTTVYSEATLRMQLTENCPDLSRVTLPGGRVTTVLASSRVDGGSLPVPSHLEVLLT